MSILSAFASVTLRSCEFESNRAGVLGGDAFILQSSTNRVAAITVMDSTFEGSSADGENNGLGGGSLALEGLDIAIIGSRFRDATASVGSGGCIASADSLRVVDSDFRGCFAASDGGAIAGTNLANVTVSSSTFKGCAARDGDGGALSIEAASTFERVTLGNNTFLVRDCTFWDNEAGRFGGALATGASSKFLLKKGLQNRDTHDNCTFIPHEAECSCALSHLSIDHP